MKTMKTNVACYVMCAMEELPVAKPAPQFGHAMQI